ncbi:hypothetical protein PHYPO_G00201680 [Pangasianodon hypophthalmus]|uniref:Uncharacterized protein n=1 Tax=Pangasianodon hypophthalmus TaxID=310915 RepID=A0A5N5PAV9_PANHP|nr:hypothetical protein PHYPO_G00201680 [Pangasianodon hypophthalmus]
MKTASLLSIFSSLEGVKVRLQVDGKARRFTISVNSGVTLERFILISVCADARASERLCSLPEKVSSRKYK